MREIPSQSEFQREEVTKEVLLSAMAGSGTLLRFLETKTAKGIIEDLVVAEVVGNPSGRIASALLPDLRKFCRKEANQIIQAFINDEAAPIRRETYE